MSLLALCCLIKARDPFFDMVLLSGLAGAAGSAAGLLTNGFLLTLTKLSIGPLVLNGFLLGGMFFFGGGTLLGGYSLGAPG